MNQIDLQWFAAEDEGKTEQPSDYKLRKAREEGRVAKSQELNGTIVTLICILLLVVLAPWILKNLEEMVVFYFYHSTDTKVDDRKFAYTFVVYFLKLVLPFAAAGIIGGIVPNIIQNKGWLFTTKTIEPKFNKIVPKFGEYLKKTLFSLQGLFNITKSILKVVIIGIIAFFIIRRNIPLLLSLIKTAGPIIALRQVSRIASQLLIISAVILVGIGVLDYIVQRREFIENLKMTKQEVKEEFKEMEGDPEVKSHLDSAQKEMLQKNIPKAVREADVLITNPTHFAVALQWKRDINYAPEVTAKGEDFLAQNMKRIARENDVPIVENRPLARGLYTDVEIGATIPEGYLRAIATVYAQIGYMDNKKSEL